MELDKEILEQMSPEEKAEYEKLIAEISAVDKKLNSVPKKSMAEILEEKKLELAAKQEAEKQKVQNEKDEVAYIQMVKKYGAKNLAVQENPNGMLIMRKPTSEELKKFEIRMERTPSEQEVILREWFCILAVYPSEETFKQMTDEFPHRWIGLGNKYNEMMKGEAVYRQKKA